MEHRAGCGIGADHGTPAEAVGMTKDDQNLKVGITWAMGVIITLLMAGIGATWYAKADVASVDANCKDIDHLDRRVTRVESTINRKLDEILKEIRK